MSDWMTFPGKAAASLAAPNDAPRAVAIWLWIVAFLVFAMVIVGGATRLTESGLSITEWKPVTGVLPPLNDAAWLAEFEKYKQIPQYAKMFPTMDIAQFKTIFFWEWSHRLLGRVIGLAFALPLLWFWVRRQIPAGMGWKLVGLLGLGGLQGAVGWWMVSSGLVNRTEVAQERLAIHLVLACLTFVGLVWLAASLGKRPGEVIERGLSRLRFGASALIVAVLVQIGLGGLVAGLRAGYTYNTWPLMDGKFIPPMEHLARLDPWWLNLLDNVTTVQFQHRMVAYGLLVLTLVHLVDAKISAPGSRAGKRAVALFGLMLVQSAFGIVTLLTNVKIHAALTHQAFAIVVLAMAVVHRQALSKAEE